MRHETVPTAIIRKRIGLASRTALGLVIAFALSTTAQAQDRPASASRLTDEQVQESLSLQMKRLTEAQKSAAPKFRMVGELQSGQKLKYALNGEDFDINDDTVIEGTMNIGSFVEVSGPYVDGEDKIANLVVVASPDSTQAGSGSTETDSDGGNIRRAMKGH